ALIGSFLTGLYTFRLYFIVFRGEPSPFVREHHHRHHGKEGPRTMLLPVAVLAVLAAIGGWIQFAPFWTPITHWLEPVATTLPARISARRRSTPAAACAGSRTACCAPTSSSSAPAWPWWRSSSSSCDDGLLLHLAPDLAADRRGDRRLGAAALAIRDRGAGRA